MTPSVVRAIGLRTRDRSSCFGVYRLVWVFGSNQMSRAWPADSRGDFRKPGNWLVRETEWK